MKYNIIDSITKFFSDFFRAFFYFISQLIIGVFCLVDVIISRVVPVVVDELRDITIEFLYLTSSMLYVIAFEVTSTLCFTFLSLGKLCLNLSDYFDRTARQILPKSFGKMGRS